MKLLLKQSILLFAVALLTACGKEEYVYPDLITEMSCLKTDEEGFGHQIITDNGIVWNLNKGNCPDGLTPDSLYRVVSRFTPVEKSKAIADSFWEVIAPIPKPESEYESVRMDPVDVQSIWRSGDYLNMVLQVMVKDQEHELAFIDNGITSNYNGTQTLHLTLLHHRKDDVEGFMKKYYLSVPLWHYEEKLNKGDAIVFELYTYKEGMTQRTFTY